MTFFTDPVSEGLLQLIQAFAFAATEAMLFVIGLFEELHAFVGLVVGGKLVVHPTCKAH